MAITPAMITEVSQFYVALFGRAPDGATLVAPLQDGLSYWTQELSNGITLPTVANQMFNTVEARAYYPGFYSNDQIVHSFYLNVLGRDDAADPVGHNYWVAALNAPGANAGTVIYQMVVATTSYVPGSVSDPAINAAAVVAQNLFNNRATVAEYYGTHKGNIAGATNALVGVTDNSASIATAETAIDTYLANANALAFTLSTGMDQGAAFTGHGIFTAADVSVGGTPTQSWTAGDAIAGTGTGNVFSVISSTAIGANPAGSTVTGIQTANLTTGLTIGNISALDTTGWTGLTQLNLTGQGTIAAKAAATTAVGVTDSVLGGSDITINGGSSVTVTDTTVGVGRVIVGTTTAPTGAVVVNHTVNAPSTLVGGTVTVNGGTTITVNETLTQATPNNTTTAGTVIITGTAATTAVTVTETKGVALVGASDATDLVTFNAVGLTTGQTVTIAGLTYTSTATTSTAALAAAFANLAVGATSGAGTGTGTYSGTLSGFRTGPVVANGSSNNVTLTASTGSASVAAPTVTGSAANATPVAIFTDGDPGTTLGIINGAVTIADLNKGSATLAATITDVTLSGFAAGTTISSNALKNLSLTNSSALVTTTEGLTTPTNTTLALTLNAATGGLTDSSNQFKTINITTTGVTSTGKAATSGGPISDSALTTLTVAGSGNYGGSTTTFAANTALTSITASNVGTFTATLGAGQGFVGTGSGKDTLTLSTVTTATLTGGSTVGNTIALPAGFTGTQSFAKITNFDTISSAATGTSAVSNVLAGTALKLTPTGTAASFTYITSDTAGASDSLTATLGAVSATAATTAGVTVATLIAKDKAGTGIDTLNLVSSYNSAGQTSTITALDTGITVGGVSQLNLSGNAAFAIGGTTAWVDAVTDLTITNDSTSTRGHSFGITDNVLASITLAGTTTGATTVALTDAATSGTLAIVDSGHGALAFNPTLATGASISVITVTDSSNAAMTLGTTATGAGTSLVSATLNNTGGALLTATDINNNTGTAFTTLSFTGIGATTVSALTLASTGTVNVTDTNSGFSTISSGALSAATGLGLSNTASGSLTVTTLTANLATALAATGTGLINATILDSKAGAVTFTDTNTGVDTYVINRGATVQADIFNLDNGTNSLTIVDSAAGANKGTINFGSGANTIVEPVHTGFGAAGYQLVNTAATGLTSATAFSAITGAITGDLLKFTDTVNVAINHDAVSTTIAAGIAAGLLTPINTISDFTVSGNSYFFQHGDALGTLSAADTLVEIVGTHLGASAATGVVSLAGGGSNFNLAVVGAETITGTSGNDTFNGTFSDAGGGTFDNTDVLKGNGGTDTLSLTNNAVSAMTLSGAQFNAVGDNSFTTFVVENTSAGAINLSAGTNFNAAFSALHLNLTAQADVASSAITIDLTAGGAAYAGTATIIANTLGATSAQVITTGAGASTVVSTTNDGAVTVNGTGLTSVQITSAVGATSAQTVGNTVATNGLATVTAIQHGAGAQVITTTYATGATVNATNDGTGGNQTIITGAGADTINLLGTFLASIVSITGGAGADAITLLSGHAAINTIVETTASTGTPTGTNFDTVTNYNHALDHISNTALVLGTQVVPTSATVATISAGGVATFMTGSDTLANHITFVEAAFPGAAGKAAIWQEGPNSFLFISDGTGGLTATDVLIELVGVTAGAMTIASNVLTAIA